MSYIWQITQEYIAMNLSKENLGIIIKEIREKKHLTQEQLALKVGKKRSYISRIESKQGSNIKIQTFIEIVEKGFGGNIRIDL
ncbi:MAG TPA: helix-turn-helix transcriptional regulator [Gelidibacter sp.]|uniref:helix-turn-helix domain-containing protein n=1 Tax=Gelidibacter sp. TaxID=2018083 RepID=UPI002C8A5075|nr:helix-turn-helix transcriptional regulator [Gelidibacter sp.]HXJ97563.1 helix-turn-helix transcriptional regulator [Gelidibacter sp.]